MSAADAAPSALLDGARLLRGAERLCIPGHAAGLTLAKGLTQLEQPAHPRRSSTSPPAQFSRGGFYPSWLLAIPVVLHAREAQRHEVQQRRGACDGRSVEPPGHRARRRGERRRVRGSHGREPRAPAGLGETGELLLDGAFSRIVTTRPGVLEVRSASRAARNLGARVGRGQCRRHEKGSPRHQELPSKTSVLRRPQNMFQRYWFVTSWWN
jgi:hypothetical protein